MHMERLVHIEWSQDSGVAEIVFQRASVLNAINVTLAEQFASAVLSISKHDGLRCLLIRGEGRAFMAGGDVGDFIEASGDILSVIDQLLDSLNPSILILRELSCPVLVACQGAVAGAGLSLVAACDLVIAASDSHYLLAYDKLGAPPDCGGSYFLPEVVGERAANELMFTGAVWSAEEAKLKGLVNRITSPEDLISDARRWAAKVAEGPTQAYAAYKSLRNDRHKISLKDYLELERGAFKAASLSADFKEGLASFQSRRLPKFRGS
jgi:2-(1,2-epoxy-1,2-dihydrophenyl)acetyl-CoA isomerase